MDVLSQSKRDLGGALSGKVIGAAIAVHRELGPGLDEADYEAALALELDQQGVQAARQVPLPLIYKGEKLDCGYRVDLRIDDTLLVELKAVDAFHPLHQAQLLTYLRLAERELGLILNFRVMLLRDGIKRVALSGGARRIEGCPEGDSAVDHELANLVMDAAREVHRELGGGLLKSAYETCLAHELSLRNLRFQRQVPTMVEYGDLTMRSRTTLPLVVEGSLMVSCHSVSSFDSLCLARDRSLLSASPLESCLSINFQDRSLAGNHLLLAAEESQMRKNTNQKAEHQQP